MASSPQVLEITAFFDKLLHEFLSTRYRLVTAI
jgi:hypothetical protein